MKFRNLVLSAVACGTVAGIAIPVIMNRTQTVRPPGPAFQPITTEGSNQEKATSAFSRGYVAYESRLPENLTACQGLARSNALFCFEGYWFSKFLAQLKSDGQHENQLPLDEADYNWTQSPEVARGTALTAFGMALAAAEKEPSVFKASVANPGLVGHLVDGWIFMLARTIGLNAAVERCRQEARETRGACEFGVGRAAWFESSGSEWVKGREPGVVAGYQFARRFTSHPTVEELSAEKPAGFGDKVAIIAKLAWYEAPAKDAESIAIYKCQRLNHPANCRKD